MKSLCFFIVLIFSVVSSANDSTFAVHCKATHNYRIVIDREFFVSSGTFAVGEFEDFVLLFNQRNQSSEVEVYNRSEESRSYAKSDLRKAGDSVELSRWTRDYIFEVTCERK